MEVAIFKITVRAMAHLRSDGMTSTDDHERAPDRSVKRILSVFLLLDCSGSMRHNGKITALNNAMREILPALRSEAQGRGATEIRIRSMAFSEEARWLDAHEESVVSYAWRDLVAAGRTSTGAALELLATSVDGETASAMALPPVIILVSDGMATDDFAKGLAILLAGKQGVRSLRFSVAIGSDANVEELKLFISDTNQDVLRADNPEDLLRQLEWSVMDKTRER